MKLITLTVLVDLFYTITQESHSINQAISCTFPFGCCCFLPGLLRWYIFGHSGNAIANQSCSLYLINTGWTSWRILPYLFDWAYKFSSSHPQIDRDASPSFGLVLPTFEINLFCPALACCNSLVRWLWLLWRSIVGVVFTSSVGSGRRRISVRGRTV